MSGMFGGGDSGPSSSPVTQLRLQTSTRGRPVPLMYGKPRVNCNLIWYGDLVATSHETSQGGKGGGGATTTNYTYTAAFIFALGEGAINSIPTIWRDKEIFTGVPATGVNSVAQDEAYSVPAGLSITVVNAAHFVSNSAVYSVAPPAPGYENGAEVRQPLVLGSDYTVSNGVYTFNSAFFSSTQSTTEWQLPGFTQQAGPMVYITYTYQSSVLAPQDACSQLNMVMTPGTYVQNAPGWMTTRHPDQAINYHGLAYVSSSLYNLGGDANLLNHSFEIDTQSGYSAAIRDANPKDVVIDLISNPHYGSGFAASNIGDSSYFSTFCIANGIFISPVYSDQKPARDMINNIMMITNAGALYSGGKLKFVPLGDVAVSGNGVTFTPNITPIYDLTDDDFIGDSSSDPIKITRKAQSDSYNSVNVKFYNRANNYNEDVAQAVDQANIEQYGLRAMDIVEMKEICDPAVARVVAQLLLQRVLYIRNTFEFHLGWSKALLEPTDLVTLTDSAMGMNKLPVRIMTIEEDEFGNLLLTAEEYPNNVCNAAQYNTQPPIPYSVNFNAAPGNATTPVIFEPPIELATSNDQLDIWIASGGGANFGGCEIWMSLDNATYRRVGKLNGSSRYGTLTSQLPTQPLPGVAAQSFGVQLLDGGQLLSGTATDLTVLSTLCYVGGEFIAYQNSTLTGTGAYTLDTINRGAYSSGEPTHNAGVDFVRIDDSIVKIPLTIDYIGKTIYIKLLAVNPFGGGIQSLADVSAHPFTVTGRFVKLAPPDMPSFTIAVKADGTRQFSFNAAGAPRDVVSGGGYRIKYRISGSNTPWANMTPLHDGIITQSPYETNNPPAGTYDFGIVEVDELGNESLTPLFVSNAVLANEPVTYGSSSNMLANSDWQTSTGSPNAGYSTELGLASLYKWNFFGTLAGIPVNMGRNYQPWNIGRGGAWWQDTTIGLGTGNLGELYQTVPVITGVDYEFSVSVNPHRCKAWMTIIWLNGSGGEISEQNSTFYDSGSGGVTYANGISGYPRLWGHGVAPAGAASAIITLRKQCTNAGNTDSYVFWNRSMFCVARAGVTEQTATPWIEAGIDNVHGGGIEPLTVGSSQISDFAIQTGKLGIEAATGLASLSQDLSIPINHGVIATNVLNFSTIGRGTVTFSTVVYAENSGNQNSNVVCVVYVDGVPITSWPSGVNFVPPLSPASYTIKFSLALGAGAHTFNATLQNTIAGTGVVPLTTKVTLSIEEIKA